MTEPLRFGAFPLGIAGGPDGIAGGPPDDMERVAEAFAELQGGKPPLVPRMYVGWTGDEAAAQQVDELAGLPWDLVLCYRDRGGDVDGFAGFVADVVRRHGDTLDSVQVTGEPNMTGLPDAADGAFPGVVRAMVLGVRAGAAVKRAEGRSAAIGIAVVPDAFGRPDFWEEVAEAGGQSFADDLDYAGLDIYPDVFGGRVPLAEVPAVVESVVVPFRETLTRLGVASATPIRICENGWPTGPERPEEEQADVLEAVIRTVHRLGVRQWQLFTLRDADSSGPTPFHHFGVLRDDYSRKPAFYRLRDLVAELG